MTVLVLGLVLFLGVHSVRIVADPWRTALRAGVGAAPWKLGYTLLSIVGLALIVWGYRLARQQPLVLWQPPVALHYVAALLLLPAFVMLAASQGPANAVRGRLRHPMLLGTKVWAFAHLLANGTLADLLLFGGFLAWAVLCFRAARQRDRVEHIAYATGTPRSTAITVVIGVVAWAVFGFWLHGPLIGVRPFG